MGVHAPACSVKADGGAIPLTASRTSPVEALLSGPAASVMGILALMPPDMAEEDLLVLDMGGTTTDIALLAHGQPLLAPRNLVIEGRSTLVRALHSLSIGLGGDSLISVKDGTDNGRSVTPGTGGGLRRHETNVSRCPESAGTRASRRLPGIPGKMTELAACAGLVPEALAAQVLDQARIQVAGAVRGLLEEVNSQPVYTLAALLENRRIRPSRAVLVGGPGSGRGSSARRDAWNARLHARRA